MNLYESSKEYLEAILILTETNKIVRAVDIANYMGYSKASISIALKKLINNSLVVVNQKDGVHLTPEGEGVARAFHDRRMVIKDILISVGVDEELADRESYRLENALSSESYNLIKKRIENNKKARK